MHVRDNYAGNKRSQPKNPQSGLGEQQSSSPRPAPAMAHARLPAWHQLHLRSLMRRQQQSVHVVKREHN